MSVHQDFREALAPRWKRYVAGEGSLQPSDDGLRLVNSPTSPERYTNAQLDDYQGLPRRSFPWRPPLALTVRARFSHPTGRLSGTAGFGFWNDPFLMTGERRLPARPRAIWFFYASPESNMKLAIEAPGAGWKAAAIDARRTAFLLLLPTAPLAVPLMNVRTLYRALWPLAQRAIGVCERAIDARMTDWHTYRLDWGEDHARFWVDGDEVLRCESPPPGPLGFVMWLDNQYAVVTPWGRFGWGLVASSERQWMEVESLAIEPG